MGGLGESAGQVSCRHSRQRGFGRKGMPLPYVDMANVRAKRPAETGAVSQTCGNTSGVFGCFIKPGRRGRLPSLLVIMMWLATPISRRPQAAGLHS